MRKLITFIFVPFFLSVVLIIFLNPSVNRLQAQVPTAELACPIANQGGPLPFGQWINPVTGKYRQYFCTDSSGNLILGGLGNTSAAGNGQLQLSGVGTSAPSLILDGTTGGASMQLGQANGAPTTLTIGGASGSTIINGGVVTFAGLGSVPAASQMKYCSDCTTAATCAGSGTGHFAVSNGTNWTCQ